MKPRYGLIRAKEFVMKDMYTFDGSEKAAEFTYDRVNESYAALLQRLQLNYIKGGYLNNIVFISLFITVFSLSISPTTQ